MATYDTDTIDVSELQRETFDRIDVNTIMQQRAVCDIMKDAVQVGKNSVKVNRPCAKLTNALGRLFPNGKGEVGWSERLASIKAKISANRTNILTDTKIPFIKYSKTENRLSDGAIRLTTDSGSRASHVQNDFFEYRTFASTIDPAPRNTTDTTFFPSAGEDIRISAKILRDILGFPIEYIHSYVSGELCIVKVKMDAMDELTIQRIRDTENHAGGGTDYCIGNSEKNKVINMLCSSDPTLEIDKYIMIKELGDVMQVVNTFVMKHLSKTDMIDVIGTSDDVVRSLCDFFKINCLKQDNVKTLQGEHVVNFIRFEEDPAALNRGANEVVKKNAIAHNNRLIRIMNRCINTNTLFVGTEDYLDDQKFRKNYINVKGFLLKMIVAIDSANTLLQGLDVNDDRDQFRGFVYELQAIHVIDERLKIRQGARRLFNMGLADTVDPILSENRNLASLITHPPTTTLIQEGGGIPSREPAVEDYTISESCPEDDEVTHAFLLNTRTLMQGGFLKIGEGEETVYITPYDVLAFLYNGLLYVGVTPFNPNIIRELIQRFVVTGGAYSLKEFETFYNSIDRTINPDTIFPYSSIPSDIALTVTQFTRLAYDPTDDFRNEEFRNDDFMAEELMTEEQRGPSFGEYVRGATEERKKSLGVRFSVPTSENVVTALTAARRNRQEKQKILAKGIEQNRRRGLGQIPGGEPTSDGMEMNESPMIQKQAPTEQWDTRIIPGGEPVYGGAIVRKHRSLRKNKYKRNRTLKKKSS